MWMRSTVAVSMFVALTACAPKVGSEAWCNELKERSRGEWTLNETADFAKFCVLRLQPVSE